MKSFFVFDVESIGLHGEAFAVGGGLYLENGAAQWEFCFSCDPRCAAGLESDRDWVIKNIPIIGITHRSPQFIMEAFWEKWEIARSQGAVMAAECMWPVETNFLESCLNKNFDRAATAPYPCHDIASIMLAAGLDPLATYDRMPSELPKHNPLADARQSARLLSEALSK